MMPTIARGLANYRIHGVVYRLMGPLRNIATGPPSCFQTFLDDRRSNSP